MPLKSNAVAIVTGAASGIGAAIVRRLRHDGWIVFAAGLQPESLSLLAAQTGAVAHAIDVTNEHDVRTLIATVLAEHGSLDAVVNAAGLVITDDVDSIKDDDWQRTLDVNLTGTMRVCRAALPGMIDQGRGSIVNLSSVAAFNASPGMASYAASKAAVVAFTRSIAHRYGPNGIRANCICPGWVRTPMSESEMNENAGRRGITIDQAFEELTTRIALRRIGTPEEIAAIAAFLASDESSFVTGVALVADGGMRLATAARAT